MMRLPQSPLANDSNLPSNFDLGIKPPLGGLCNNIRGKRRTTSNPFPHVLPLGFGDPRNSLPELPALRFGKGLEEIWALTSSHWPALASQPRDRLRPTAEMLLSMSRLLACEMAGQAPLHSVPHPRRSVLIAHPLELTLSVSNNCLSCGGNAGGGTTSSSP